MGMSMQDKNTSSVFLHTQNHLSVSFSLVPDRPTLGCCFPQTPRLILGGFRTPDPRLGG